MNRPFDTRISRRKFAALSFVVLLLGGSIISFPVRGADQAAGDFVKTLGERAVQLRERYWRVFSLSGALENVRGRGVVGEEPILSKEQPAFQYSSHINLQVRGSVVGNAVGDAAPRVLVAGALRPHAGQLSHGARGRVHVRRAYPALLPGKQASGDEQQQQQ